jgi:hypothetical protein
MKKRFVLRCSCSRRGEYTCDHVDEDGRVCNEPLCRRCAMLIRQTADGPIHYCPDHQRMKDDD